MEGEAKRKREKRRMRVEDMAMIKRQNMPLENDVYIWK